MYNIIQVKITVNDIVLIKTFREFKNILDSYRDNGEIIILFEENSSFIFRTTKHIIFIRFHINYVLVLLTKRTMQIQSHKVLIIE